MALESDNHLLPAKDGKKRKRWRVVAACGLIILLLIFWFWGTKHLAPAAINQLAEITNTKIKADSVTFSPKGAVLIRGLHIKPDQDSKHDNTILSARKVYVRFSIFSLVTFNPKIRKISLHDFKIYFQHDTDAGKWNIETIKLPSGKDGGGLFEVRLKNGELHYTTIKNEILKAAMSIPINGHLEPSDGKGYDFYLTTAKGDKESFSRIVGSIKPGYFNFSGGVSSDDLPELKHKWSAEKISAECNYAKDGDFNLKFLVDSFTCQGRGPKDIDLAQSETIEEAGFLTKIQQVMEQYHLSGTIDTQLQANGNFNQPKDIKLNGSVFCKDVSVLYSVFPYQIENLQGRIDFTEKNLKAEDLTGRHGDVKLAINSKFSNFGPDVKGNVIISSDYMPLDNDLYKALWPAQKLLWNEFEPTGFVEFEYNFSIEAGAEKKFALDVELINVDSTYKHFPYLMNDLTGNLLFDVDSIVVTNLKSKQDDRIININGNVIETDTDKPKFDLVIDVNEIPLNDMLADALPPKERNLYNMFEPEGFGSGKILINNMSADPNKVYFNADLNFKDTILRPPMLTGDITDIAANGIFEPDKINFKKFDGIYAGQPVSMKGIFNPTEDGNDLAYKMVLSNERVIINNDILNLISERLKKHIDKIKPSGALAYSALLSKQAYESKADYDVTLNCIDVNLQSEITDIPLEHITGSINISQNALTFTNLSTNPAGTDAPEININGQVLLLATDANETKIETATISVDANNFPVETKHLDKLSGTLIYDKNKDRWFSDNVYGEFYDGKMAGKLEIKKKNKKNKAYVTLQIGFNKANLRKFLADTNNLPDDCIDGSCYSTGQMSGQINVAGTAGDLSSFYGSCRVEINDMQIGELSPIARVLTLLKLTKSSDYLFEKMFFDTYLKDQMFYFETFELSGATLNFGGTGWMDIQSKELDLTFAARGSRISDVSNDLIGSLTSALSPGILQVHVTGNALKPNVQVKPFPIFGSALDLIGTKEN